MGLQPRSDFNPFSKIIRKLSPESSWSADARLTVKYVLLSPSVPEAFNLVLRGRRSPGDWRSNCPPQRSWMCLGRLCSHSGYGSNGAVLILTTIIEVVHTMLLFFSIPQVSDRSCCETGHWRDRRLPSQFQSLMTTLKITASRGRASSVRKGVRVV